MSQADTEFPCLLDGPSTDESVTEWIAGLKIRESEAAYRLWHRYYPRMVQLARRRLRGSNCRIVDEEDIAQHAFLNLWQGASGGRFPELRDRHNLWPLLVVLIRRRTCDVIRYERRRHRDGLQVDLEQIPDTRPPVERHHVGAETVEQLVSQLHPRLRELAHFKLEGLANAEIARRLDWALRTVERRWQLIRRTWTAQWLAESRRE
jgi:RNA polymerase sigma factor (sigma-70 family)